MRARGLCVHALAFVCACVCACARTCVCECAHAFIYARGFVRACARLCVRTCASFFGSFFSAKARVRGMIAGSGDPRDIFKVYQICNFILLSPTLANERFPLYFSCFGSTTKFDLTDL